MSQPSEQHSTHARGGVRRRGGEGGDALRRAMTDHLRAFVSSCQAVALWLLALLFGSSMWSAAGLAATWVIGTSLLSYAAGSGWMGWSARRFVLALLGHDAPSQAQISQAMLDREIRRANAMTPAQLATAMAESGLQSCSHGGFLFDGRCFLNATHPRVVCVGCGDLVCPRDECWLAHQAEKRCAVTREAQALAMKEIRAVSP